MSLVGVERIVFGVEDMALCRKFWLDFGLTQIEDQPDRAVFECVTRASLEIRPLDDPDLPAPVAEGSNARETIWGASDQETVDAIAAELALDRAVTVGADGTVHSTDPEGYGIGFRVTRRQPLAPFQPGYNPPDAPTRFDKPATFYERAIPQHLAHVVFQITDLDATPAFYRDRLGFRVTDRYIDRAVFLRCDGANDHHNIAMFKVGGKGFHHLAFEVRDFHEVFGGGCHMDGLGWQTHLGPGRHGVTSAYFWYFKAPSGGAAEYGYDTDRLTDAWTPRELESTPEIFAEWAIEFGINRYDGVQRGIAERSTKIKAADR